MAVLKVNGLALHEDSPLLIYARDAEVDLGIIIEALRSDNVVLVKGLMPNRVESIIESVANRLDLKDSLELQAGLASFVGHRRGVGKYFMTVTHRDNYQVIPPHSEGDSFVGMQLACFYCHQNTTDGGESLLFRVDSGSRAWGQLREKRRRGVIGKRRLEEHEIVRARGLYGLILPQDSLGENDHVLAEVASEIPDLRVFEVLAEPVMTLSKILDRRTFTYWDSVGSIDIDSGLEFLLLLKENGMLRGQSVFDEMSRFDNAFPRRVWHSGVKYEDIFDRFVACRLEEGDLLIQNNLTWAHAAANWTPGSGTRSVFASFA